jgi:hypothetical protein
MATLKRNKAKRYPKSETSQKEDLVGIPIYKLLSLG